MFLDNTFNEIVEGGNAVLVYGVLSIIVSFALVFVLYLILMEEYKKVMYSFGVGSAFIATLSCVLMLPMKIEAKVVDVELNVDYGMNEVVSEFQNDIMQIREQELEDLQRFVDTGYVEVPYKVNGSTLVNPGETIPKYDGLTLDTEELNCDSWEVDIASSVEATAISQDDAAVSTVTYEVDRAVSKTSSRQYQVLNHETAVDADYLRMVDGRIFTIK